MKKDKASHIVSLKMTDEEFENLRKRIEELNADSKKYSQSSYIREQVFSDKPRMLKEIWIDVRRMRSECNHAMRRLKESENKTDAVEHLSGLLDETLVRLSEFMERLGDVYGNNQDGTS